MLLEAMMTIMAVLFSGHLGKNELAAASFANSVSRSKYGKRGVNGEILNSLIVQCITLKFFLQKSFILETHSIPYNSIYEKKK